MADLEKWQNQHSRIIDEFLFFLNQRSNDFVLKGETALLKCYGLDRFSEDIDLDGQQNDIKIVVQDFCNKYDYSFRVAKDTNTVKRCMLHYNGEKPLKVEVSYRRNAIPKEEITVINGVLVYTIDRLASMKASAYLSRDRIRDLYDVSFICNKYLNQLSEPVKNQIRDAIEYKGLEQFDYLVSTQKDELINESALVDSFLKMTDNLGVLLEIDEENTIKIFHDSNNELIEDSMDSHEEEEEEEEQTFQM